MVDTYLARGSGDNDSSFRTRRDEFTRSMYRSIGSNRHQEERNNDLIRRYQRNSLKIGFSIGSRRK